MDHLFEVPDSTENVVIVALAIIMGADSTEKFDVSSLSPRASKPVEPSTPWLGYEGHDNYPCMAFEQYPVARGWNTTQIWHLKLHRAHASLAGLTEAEVVRRVSAFLQSWLYLGFLESCLGFKVSVNSITCETSDGPKLYTKHLVLWLRAWMSTFHLKRISNADLTVYMSRVDGNAMTVSDWATKMVLWESSLGKGEQETYTGLDSLSGDISPSISQMLSAVFSIRKELLTWRGLPDRPRNQTFSFSRNVIRDRKAAMRERGWCPFTLEMLHYDMAPPILDWAVAADLLCYPTEPRTGQIGRHANCSISQCVLNTVGSGEVAAHRSHCAGDCGLWKPAEEELEQLIEDGMFPVITWTASPSRHSDRGMVDLSLTLTGVDILSKPRYVAFSHVWAEGLGDPTHRGLPLCQMERLVQLGEAATQDAHSPIWIDSLMIPEKSSLRGKVILQMGQIFEEASIVLILDQGLQTLSYPKDMTGYKVTGPLFVEHSSLTQTKELHTPSMEELLFRVRASAWMQRLWTYQEVALSSNPCVVLGNALFFPLNLDVLISATGSHRFQGAHSIDNLRTNGFGRPENCSDVVRAITWRLASKPSDEILAIGPTLGVPSNDILHLAEEERMVTLLCKLPSVPTSLLFQDGPRISINGFTWAQKTFMKGQAQSTEFDPSVGHCLPNDDRNVGGFVGVVNLIILERPLNIDQGYELQEGYIDHNILVSTEEATVVFTVKLNAKPVAKAPLERPSLGSTNTTSVISKPAVRRITESAQSDTEWQTPGTSEKIYDGIVLEEPEASWTTGLLVQRVRQASKVTAGAEYCFKVVDSVRINIIGDRQQNTAGYRQLMTDFSKHALNTNIGVLGKIGRQKILLQ